MRQIALIQSAESSNAIEGIEAPRARIEAIVKETTEPRNRSEQEIAGYRFVLDTIHANAANMDFEPRFVEQLHGYMARFTGDTTAGQWKELDNEVEEIHADGSKTVRFMPVSATKTPEAMAELHEAFRKAIAADPQRHLLYAAAYVFDFLVIHPFRDGNGRMSRLLTLWLLYMGGYDVGRYISLEKLIEDSKETYYEALKKSTVDWHQGQHDLGPWVEYFLGIVNAAYTEFENRTVVVARYGSKKMLVKRYIASSARNEFTIEDIRQNAPNVGDSTIKKVLAELRKDDVIERLSAGRGAKYRRLRSDFLDISDDK